MVYPQSTSEYVRDIERSHDRRIDSCHHRNLGPLKFWRHCDCRLCAGEALDTGVMELTL